MVQGYSGYAKYNGGMDVARKIFKSDGIRGFYRGFGLSIMTYSPSSAVWWASYGSSQRIIWRSDTPLYTLTPNYSKSSVFLLYLLIIVLTSHLAFSIVCFKINVDPNQRWLIVTKKFQATNKIIDLLVI